MSGLSDEVRNYIENFKTRYSMNSVKRCTEDIQNLKVLVVGDIIIDEYIYCSMQGMMSKDMRYSTRYHSEQYLGGF